MLPNERPVTEVLKSIVGNVEDIVRGEVKLVKAEVREQVARTTAGAGWMAVGAVAVFFGVGFGLLAAFLGLSLVLPDWMAAALIALVLAIVVVFALLIARRRRDAVLLRRAP